MPVEFIVMRDNIRVGKFVDPVPPKLKDNQIRMEVIQFAFTANNITYANTGERLGYWKFFPTSEDGWGIIPVWGFGKVIESKHPEIKIGERIYGYFPMAAQLVVTPDKVNPYGFMDAAKHRQELSPIYNRYVRADADTGYEEKSEAINALLRPMFTTSFLLDDFFADKQMFGAKNIILSSASSKTGYGTAFLLNANREDRPEYKVIGLTSPANVDFVESLGCYDEVLTYGDMTKLDKKETAAYIDFSGSLPVRKTLHEHFGDNLKYDCSVGSTHWESIGSTKGIPGVKAEFFFAPSQLEKRLKDWGNDGYRERMTSAWTDFTKKANKWIDVTKHEGNNGIVKVYQDMVKGIAKPEKGYMLSF